jgi:hypothetical protein
LFVEVVQGRRGASSPGSTASRRGSRQPPPDWTGQPVKAAQPGWWKMARSGLHGVFGTTGRGGFPGGSAPGRLPGNRRPPWLFRNVSLVRARGRKGALAGRSHVAGFPDPARSPPATIGESGWVRVGHCTAECTADSGSSGRCGGAPGRRRIPVLLPRRSRSRGGLPPEVADDGKPLSVRGATVRQRARAD